MNSIAERIEKDFLEAYKAKEENQTNVLRMLKSSMKNSAIEKKGELDESDVVRILQREIKQRRDSIEQFKAGGRSDLADKEASEIPIIESYLPAQLSENEIKVIVESTITETGASSKTDFGKVMGKAMSQVAGRADGNTVKKIVSDLLND